MAVFLISTRKIKKTDRNNQSFLVIITKKHHSIKHSELCTSSFFRSYYNKNHAGHLTVERRCPAAVSLSSFRQMKTDLIIKRLVTSHLLLL